MTFVVGEKPEDYTWIDILGATIAAGSRRLFSVISKEQLEAEVMCTQRLLEQFYS